mmetsp:Transcript_103010/g.321019  ORF Transcript_103010/g.321019 Transcript_103010/m.321019 type:complete len:144 (+) Transcript_103010:83-514(+)
MHRAGPMPLLVLLLAVLAAARPEPCIDGQECVADGPGRAVLLQRRSVGDTLAEVVQEALTGAMGQAAAASSTIKGDSHWRRRNQWLGRGRAGDSCADERPDCAQLATSSYSCQMPDHDSFKYCKASCMTLTGWKCPDFKRYSR